MESAASLANHLFALLRSNSSPDTSAATRTFAAYQRQRKPVAKHWHNSADLHLRMLCWQTIFYERGQKVFSLINGSWRILWLMSPWLSSGVKLDYVAFRSLEGKIRWNPRPIHQSLTTVNGTYVLPALGIVLLGMMLREYTSETRVDP